MAKGIVFGADYYHEQWDRSLWESDARRMQTLGLKAVRRMEFAWTLIEAREGEYDFSLFDEVIALFARYDIKVVLGTPTATFPAWLFEKDPSVVQTYPDGTYRDFGTRRRQGRAQPCRQGGSARPLPGNGRPQGEAVRIAQQHQGRHQDRRNTGQGRSLGGHRRTHHCQTHRLVLRPEEAL